MEEESMCDGKETAPRSQNVCLTFTEDTEILQEESIYSQKIEECCKIRRRGRGGGHHMGFGL